MDREYRLYIIARTDLASMTAGRTAAQASHATSCFEIRGKQTESPLLLSAISNWRQGLFFGTTIVLGGNYSIMEAVALACNSTTIRRKHDFMYGEVWDPDYRIPDGESFISGNVLTCVYVFCDTELAKNMFCDIPLR